MPGGPITFAVFTMTTERFLADRVIKCICIFQASIFDFEIIRLGITQNWKRILDMVFSVHLREQLMEHITPMIEIART